MNKNEIAKNILLEKICDTCKHKFSSVCKLLETRPKEYTCQFWEGFEKIKVVRLGYPNLMRDSIKPINYDPIEIKINMEFNKVEDK